MTLLYIKIKRLTINILQCAYRGGTMKNNKILFHIDSISTQKDKKRGICLVTNFQLKEICTIQFIRFKGLSQTVFK